MVQAISIENFRCFHHSIFEGFGRINLIGGKNNSGKTSLLEAILLSNVPGARSISFLQSLRGENTALFSENPEYAWTNLFYNQEKNQKIKFSSRYGNGSIEVEIFCEEREKSTLFNQKPLFRDPSENVLIPGIDSAVLAEVGASSLKIKANVGNQKFTGYIEYIYKNRRELRGGERFVPLKEAILVPAGYKRSSAALGKDFERIKLLGKGASILKAFKIVDDSIENVDVINLGEPKIIITRQGFAPQPLNYFGDALNKIADIVLRIENSPQCILLIDEIENGIHHTNQEEFWRMLIKLASENDVQIFCTSHSGEMINAFKRATSASNGQNIARYFELIKSARTGEIVANQIDNETLDYNIKTNHPFRGE